MHSKGLIWDELTGWIIAVVVLVLGLFAYTLLSGRGNAAIDFMSNLLRFGR